MLHSAYASITPRDEYNAAYLSFILLGAGFLFPWNAVITAVDYFNGLFPNQNIEVSVWVHTNVEAVASSAWVVTLCRLCCLVQFDFTLCYMCPNLFGLIFVVMWGERLTFRVCMLPSPGNHSAGVAQQTLCPTRLQFRIIFGFLIFLACIVAMPFITVKWLSLTVVCILGFR